MKQQPKIKGWWQWWWDFVWAFRKARQFFMLPLNLRCCEAKTITSILVPSSQPGHLIINCSEHTSFPISKKKKIKIKILRCENSHFLDSSLHAIPINVSAFKAIITHLFLIFDHLSIPALNLCHDPMSNNFLRDTWVHCWVSNYLITTTYAKFSISDI